MRTLGYFGIFLSTMIVAPFPAAARDHGADRLIDLFFQACVSTQGDPKKTRAVARRLGGGPLHPAIKVGLLKGPGAEKFGFAIKGTNLGLISEDAGICTVLGGKMDVERVFPGIETAIKRRFGAVSITSRNERASSKGRSYAVAIADTKYNIVASTNNDPKGLIQVMVTLSR